MVDRQTFLLVGFQAGLLCQMLFVLKVSTSFYFAEQKISLKFFYWKQEWVLELFQIKLYCEERELQNVSLKIVYRAKICVYDLRDLIKKTGS